MLNRCLGQFYLHFLRHSSPLLLHCFYHACANQVSVYVCVCGSLIVPACVNTAPAGVCLCLNRKILFFHFFSEKVEEEKGISEEPNQPITKQIIRLGGLRGVRQGCYYTGKKKFLFWIATQRPITIHKQTKTTLYTNDPVWVCVCVWKDGKK